jgi:hypothetical protein
MTRILQLYRENTAARQLHTSEFGNLDVQLWQRHQLHR